MKKLRQKIVGIGLLELTLALSVIAIIITLATRYFIITTASQKTNEAAEMIANLAVAGEKWLVTHNDYDDLTKLQDLQDRNYFPKTVENNPWGGNITVIGKGNTLSITLSGIPQTNCLSLAQKLLSATCDTTYKAEDFCGTNTPADYKIQIIQPKTCYDKVSS